MNYIRGFFTNILHASAATGADFFMHPFFESVLRMGFGKCVRPFLNLSDCSVFLLHFIKECMWLF